MKRDVLRLFTPAFFTRQSLQKYNNLPMIPGKTNYDWAASLREDSGSFLRSLKTLAYF